jgi:outer membrane protein
MKSYFALSALFVALAMGSSTASAQTALKIGTVDMKRVFESYYRTKEAEAKINEARNAMKKEFEDRMDFGRKLAEEVRKLEDDIKKPELSKQGSQGPETKDPQPEGRRVEPAGS